jgi:hypothetical protein
MMRESRPHLHDTAIPREEQARVLSYAKENARRLGQLHAPKQPSVEIVPSQQPSSRPRRRITAGWLSRPNHPHRIPRRDEHIANRAARVVGSEQNFGCHDR